MSERSDYLDLKNKIEYTKSKLSQVRRSGKKVPVKSGSIESYFLQKEAPIRKELQQLQSDLKKFKSKDIQKWDRERFDLIQKIRVK